jgi:hypothetical protein
MAMCLVPTGAQAPDLVELADTFLKAQRSQWNNWLRFQESLATFYKDFWEQWALRFVDAARIED